MGQTAAVEEALLDARRLLFRAISCCCQKATCSGTGLDCARKRASKNLQTALQSCEMAQQRRPARLLGCWRWQWVSRLQRSSLRLNRALQPNGQVTSLALWEWPTVRTKESG